MKKTIFVEEIERNRLKLFPAYDDTIIGLKNDAKVVNITLHRDIVILAPKLYPLLPTPARRSNHPLP